MSGWKIDCDADEVMADLTEYVSQIQNKLSDDDIKKCLKEIGATIKKNVTQYAPKSNINHTHIKNDVKSKIKKSSSTGQYYVSVSGGKDTGYKWLWVNDGHIAENGTKVPGNHFVDKAEAASQSDIESIVDKWIEGILK